MLQWLCAVRAQGEGVAAHLNYFSHTLGVSYTFRFTLYHHDNWLLWLLSCDVTSQLAFWTVPKVIEL
jgi:hypothetical protein